MDGISTSTDASAQKKAVAVDLTLLRKGQANLLTGATLPRLDAPVIEPETLPPPVIKPQPPSPTPQREPPPAPFIKPAKDPQRCPAGDPSEPHRVCRLLP